MPTCIIPRKIQCPSVFAKKNTIKKSRKTSHRAKKKTTQNHTCNVTCSRYPFCSFGALKTYLFSLLLTSKGNVACRESEARRSEAWRGEAKRYKGTGKRSRARTRARKRQVPQVRGLCRYAGALAADPVIDRFIYQNMYQNVHI